MKNGKDTSGDNLILYEDGSGYCFACAYYKRKDGIFIKNPTPIESDVVLPEDILPLINSHAGWHWLKQYLTDIPNWILWSPNKQWLIFPYFIDGKLKAFQARNLSGEGSKWLTFGQTSDIIFTQGQEKDTIILVEDIVSAIKIGQGGSCSAPMFGCKIDLNRLLRLKDRFSSIGIWLDPDKAFEASQQAYRANKMGFKIGRAHV